MPEHQISLPEKVYFKLLAAANADKIGPADWIASQLPTASTERISNVKSIDDLIGAIDSQHEPNQDYETNLDEAIANKLDKQGIKRP